MSHLSNSWLLSQGRKVHGSHPPPLLPRALRIPKSFYETLRSFILKIILLIFVDYGGLDTMLGLEMGPGMAS